jgi:hypothetical protein
MRQRRLTAHDEGSLKTALAALAGEHTDSDGDGAADLDELRTGDDPNRAPGEELLVPDYGCALTRPLRSPAAPTPLHLAAAGLVLIGLRRGARR